MSFGRDTINNLEKKRPTFLKVGYVVTLAVLLAAFEWRTPVKPVDELIIEQDWDTLDIDIPMTNRNEKKQQKQVVMNPPPVVPIPVPEPDPEPEPGPEPIPNPDSEPDSELLPGPVDTVPPEWLPFPEFTASFPGGETELSNFLKSRIYFTPAAIEFEEQGVVYVEFTVTKDGSITNAKVLKGLGYGLNDIALKAVREMPAWIPARQGIHPVASPFVLPVKFTLIK